MKPTLKEIAMVLVALPVLFLITILLAYPTKWLGTQLCQNYLA